MTGNDRKPKVLIMTPGILPVPAVRGGAVETLITDIIDENEKEKAVDITVVTISDSDIPQDKYRHTRIIPVNKTVTCKFADRLIDKILRTVHAPKAFLMFDRSLMKGLRAAADISGFDVIVVENMVGLAEAVVKEAEEKGSRARIFVHLHNKTDMYRSVSGIKKLAQKGVTFLSVSKYIKSEILKEVPEANISVLYNGIDAKLLDRGLKDRREELREKYGIPTGSTVILYIGRIIAEKGVYELVHSFVMHRKKEKGPGLFLVLAGGGVGMNGKMTDYEKKVQREITEACRSVKLLGRVPYDSIPEVYAAADVLIVPTLVAEAFGMVVLEGMAMGLPIITTATGGIPEVLEDGKGCIKISKERICEELTEVFDRIADEKFCNMLNEMGAHNLKIYKNKKRIGKEDYYDLFLSAVGINSEGTR